MIEAGRNKRMLQREEQKYTIVGESPDKMFVKVKPGTQSAQKDFNMQLHSADKMSEDGGFGRENRSYQGENESAFSDHGRQRNNEELSPEV